MKKSFVYGILVVAVMVLSLNSCYYDVEEELYATTTTSTTCTDTTATYTSGTGRVKAIMDNYCSYAGCHDAVTSASGYDLTTLENVQNSIDNVVCTIEQTGSCQPMPQNLPKLSTCDITAIKKWQTAGFPQ